ncbi:MAG: hypothetical protein PWQ18_917 [Clostridia bacterium]|nr:hypothetical protein [Clostridia bacterium]
MLGKSEKHKQLTFTSLDNLSQWEGLPIVPEDSIYAALFRSEDPDPDAQAAKAFYSHTHLLIGYFGCRLTRICRDHDDIPRWRGSSDVIGEAYNYTLPGLAELQSVSIAPIKSSAIMAN